MKDKDNSKDDPDNIVKGFDVDLKGFDDINLNGFDVDLKELDVHLPKNIGLFFLYDTDLLKIIKDLQELGDIRNKTPEELVTYLRNKWHEEDQDP